MSRHEEADMYINILSFSDFFGCLTCNLIISHKFSCAQGPNPQC